MPIAGDRARLKNRRSGLDLNQNDNCRRQGNRRGSVQQNTKRAVVGIGIYRMHVRHLDYGQQRQQDQAHDGDDRQSGSLCTPSPAELSLKSCQSTTPT